MFFNNLFNNYSPFNNFSNFPYRSYPRPETAYPNDNRSVILNKLINDENNYICFDCHRQTNGIKYYDIRNAIFICYNCAIQHTHLPKEVSEVITGDIRTLEEKYLLILYYGGNKNLIEFIRRYYPLLEKMERYKMYSTKAMDYYRKLILAKTYNEPEPYMPRKLEGYNSIFKNSINPANENNYNNIRNNRAMMDTEEEKNNDLYNSSCFRGNPFGRYKTKNKNGWQNPEPAVINNENTNNDNEDIEMKDDTGKKSENYICKDNEGINNKENKSQNKKINNHQSKYKNKENSFKNNKNENINKLTINQLGQLSMYPDAKEIDEMD